jgi:hypothetical protein
MDRGNRGFFEDTLGWDFDSVWGYSVLDGYEKPHLKVFNEPETLLAGSAWVGQSYVSVSRKALEVLNIQAGEGLSFIGQISGVSFSTSSFNGVTIEWGGERDRSRIYLTGGDIVTDGETEVTVNFSVLDVPQPEASFTFKLNAVGRKAAEAADTAATPGITGSSILPDGVEVGIDPRVITENDISDLPQGAGNIKPAGSTAPDPAAPEYKTVVNGDGEVTANPAAVLAGLDGSTAARLGLDNGAVVPLPMFTARVAGNDSTALVTLKTTLNALAGRRFDDLVALKLKRPPNGRTVELGRADGVESVDHGMFVITDDSGVPIPGGTLVESGAYYYVTVGIGDDRDGYDWDLTPGQILDPMLISAHGGGSDPVSGGSGGGCSSGVGAFGMALLAAAAWHIAPRKRK